VWDVATGEKRRTLTGHKGWINAVAFGPDGTTLATGGNDGTVRLWDVATGKQRRTLTGHRGAVLDLSFDSEGGTLATGGADGTVRLWDPAGGGERRTINPGRTAQVYDVAFSPDGTLLATNTATALSVWKAATGGQVDALPVKDGVINALAFGPDSRTLAYGLDNDGLHLWEEVATGKKFGKAPRRLTGHRDEVSDISFSPDGRSLATGSVEGGTARLWDTTTGQERHVFDHGRATEVYHMAFNARGTSLTTVSGDGGDGSPSFGSGTTPPEKNTPSQAPNAGTASGG
jgi:WD40 repeat protein